MKDGLSERLKNLSLKQRWMISCLAIVTVLVLVAVAVFAGFARAHADEGVAGSATTVAIVIGVVGIAVLAAVNLHFINSVTNTVKALNYTARCIAEGSYGVQTENDRSDELGQLTDSINEMSEKIAHAEKLQTEFISSVSHELRTPQTAITGWSETLEYDEAIQGDSKRGIEIISREAGRLTKMVGELLEFTRIQDGRFNLDVEEMDLAAEVEDVVFTFGKLLHQDNIELEYTPCQDDTVMIKGDQERIKQVLLNIIDNAAKYGRGGGVIAVSLETDEYEAVIRVRDHGPGIPPEELPRVKEKFYKGSGKERGSGIGLAVCEEIVSRHSGRLLIENAADGGVLVSVILPKAI